MLYLYMLQVFHKLREIPASLRCPGIGCLSSKLRHTQKGLSLSIRLWYVWMKSVLLLQTWPLVAILCYVLETWQQSALKSEKLRQVNDRCKLNGQLGRWETWGGYLVLRLPGKPVFRFSHSFVLHSTFKLDFIQLPLSTGFQYVLVVCVFSRWVKAFPYHQPDTFTVANKPLDNVFSLHTESWDSPW